MKQLLLILVCLPIIGFGQTAEEYFAKENDYQKERDYKYQIDNYTKCLQIAPNYFEAYDNRGRAYYNIKNYKAAIAD